MPTSPRAILHHTDPILCTFLHTTVSIIVYYITETFPKIKCGGSECDPNSKNPCCSLFGFCGISVDHCECEGCIDSRSKTDKIGN